MKYWLLAIGCLVYAVALVVFAHLSLPEVARIGLYGAYGFAGVAACITALSYSNGDRLRWAWLAFGVGYLIAFASKLFVADSTTVAGMPFWRATLWAVATLLLNVGQISALVLFSRVWSGTGLAPPWRGRATLAFVVVALAFDGRSLFVNTRAMMDMSPQAFGGFISTASDVIAIALVGPIFATAIALRGGLLMRPWLFLFGSIICWLIDDAVAIIPGAFALDLEIVVRSMAVLISGAAAVAQLMVKREVNIAIDRE